jgi:putative ABC transport system permease protein
MSSVVASLRRFLLRLLAFMTPGRANADITRELAAHLRLLEDDFVARGMSPEQARFAARRAFAGQLEQTRMRHRDARSFRILDEWWLDARLAARMLIKYPALTLVGGMGLAVAVAISTVSFSFFYSYIVSDLPLDEGSRIVALENWNVEINNEERRALHDYHSWRAEMSTMEDLGAFRTVTRNLIIPDGAVEPVRFAEMTASGFRIARVAPLLGRPLLDDDERPGATAVLVIGYDIWQTRFGGDSTVVGRVVRVGNTPTTIVGVMPHGFLFPVNHDYWIPLRTDSSGIKRGEGPAIFVFGRLARGATLEQAQSELTAIGQRAAAAFPTTHAKLRPAAMRYAYPILDIQDVSLAQVAAMQSIVSLALIIVAANLAVLLYARTANRRSELALRTALGASRRRLVGQLFVEALVLATCGAAAGLLLAKFGLTQVHQLMELEVGRLPFWIDDGLPPLAVAYVAGLAALAALIAGVLPALSATGGGTQATLRQLGGTTGAGLGATWTVLVVGQVAIAVAFLPIVLGIAYGELRGSATGPVFDVQHFLVAGLAMDPEPPPGIDAAAFRQGLASRFQRIETEFVNRLETEPWVADITIATQPAGLEPRAAVEIEGLSQKDPAAAAVGVNAIDADFFDLFGARVIAGRTFTPSDRRTRGDIEAGAIDGPRPVVVNQTFVSRVLGGGDALGRRVRFAAVGSPPRPGSWLEIVGVVSDLHTNRLQADRVPPVLYRILDVGVTSGASVFLRLSAGSPSSHESRLREIAAAIDPTLRVNAYPMSRPYRQATVAMRFVGAAITLVTLSVLLLTAAGVYALMSFTVSQRRKEIAIRAALGADPVLILRGIFGRSAAQLVLGILLGGAMAALIDMLAEADMWTNGAWLLPAISLLVIGTGLLASMGPARRALRMQPTEALREE